MLIIRIESGVVVEVLLNVYERNVVLRKKLPYAGGVGRLVAWNLVGVDVGGDLSEVGCAS